MDHPNAIAALNDFQPDTLWLHGYGQKANWRALFCLRRKLQVIYSSDSNVLESRGFLKRWVKQSLLRIFFARCDHFLAISESNETYLKYYGVSAQKIHRVPFPIDMQFWCAEARRVSDKQSCQQLKDKLGIGLHSRVFLFAGKLLAHKAPDDLVHAFARLADKDAFLIIIGNGPKKENLMTLVSELGLKTRVHFTGFLNQQELGNYFAVSDVLVFPSHKEPYGAIAAEVLPFGLALIVSDQVGALGGPVQTDANALVYPAGDVAKLAACINSLVDDEVLLEKFAKHSRALAEAQDAGHMAKTIGNLCRLPQNIF
jgi:glycosyltransferase involved in cell wall biosynthesis